VSPATERVIHMMSDEINDLQADSIRQLSDLTRHGYKWIDITVRKDGVERRFEADWVANLLNPRIG
jgi:hypothetical protein